MVGMGLYQRVGRSTLLMGVIITEPFADRWGAQWLAYYALHSNCVAYIALPLRKHYTIAPQALPLSLGIIQAEAHKNAMKGHIRRVASQLERSGILQYDEVEYRDVPVEHTSIEVKFMQAK